MLGSVLIAGVSAEEWLAWLQRMDRKLDDFLEKFNRPEFARLEGTGEVADRLADLETRVAKIERKLDISTTLEPH